MPITFAAVADDDTGATDLAGMLSAHGLRSILVIEDGQPKPIAEWSRDCDAVIIGIASRAIPPQDAYNRTRTAVRLLHSLQPRTIQVKYCSTFDSTSEGNIGPSIDAAMDALGESFTIAIPALPINGRTTYMGHHFVGQQLLSDSSLRHHPLNPMTNSNLVSHLQMQTRRRVGLVPYSVVSAGPERICEHFWRFQKQRVNIAITDCTNDADLQSICQAIAPMQLITGSSAPAIGLPPIWRKNGWWQPSAQTLLLPAEKQRGSGFLIVSGSCSEATRRQNQWIESCGCPSFQLDAPELVGRVAHQLRAGHTCLLSTPNTVMTAAQDLAHSVASLVKQILQAARPQGLIVAGGETSGAVCRKLQLGGLRVGRNIEPGVPLCVSITEPFLPIVLKSGNFGSDDFYQCAIEAIQSLSPAA